MRDRKFKSMLFGIALLATLAIPAFADQAAWVSRTEAARALEILAKSESIRHYCAPCDDKSVRSETIESIGLYKVDGENYWEIRVNGKGIDLAYVYFEKKKGKWRNAAIEAKIDVKDVPKQLSDSQSTAN